MRRPPPLQRSGVHGEALPVLNSHDIVGCGNAGFPKLNAPPGILLTLGALPLETLGG